MTSRRGSNSLGKNATFSAPKRVIYPSERAAKMLGIPREKLECDIVKLLSRALEIAEDDKQLQDRFHSFVPIIRG